MSEKKPCKSCEISMIHDKGLLKNVIVDGGTVLLSTGCKPDAKYHCVMITKRHADDLRQMTFQEWNDMLPTFKEGINIIESYYKYKGKSGPLGYRISMPTGANSSQNQAPHFYARLVPKYKKGYGSCTTSNKYKTGTPAFPEQLELIKKTLAPNSAGVISEKSRVVAKFYDKSEQMVSFFKECPHGRISISTKNYLPNDIQAIDQETWNEIGETLKETMAKIEKNTDCHDFSVEIRLGKKATKLWKEEAELPVDYNYPEAELTELTVDLFPRYQAALWWKPQERPVQDGQLITFFDYEREAKKLKNPEAYYKEWGKKLPRQEEETNSSSRTLPTENQRESLWKQPTTYLLIASGVGITCLGLGIYWLFSKNKKSSK